MDENKELPQGLGKISRRAFGGTFAIATVGLLASRVLGERLGKTDTPLEHKIDFLFQDTSRGWDHYTKSALDVVRANLNDRNGEFWQVLFKTAISNENRTFFMGSRDGIALASVVQELNQAVYGNSQYPRKLSSNEVTTALDWVTKTGAKEKYNRVEVQKVSYNLDATKIESYLGVADTDEKKRQIEQLKYLKGVFPDNKYPPGSVFRKVTSVVVADHSHPGFGGASQPPGTTSISKNLITRVSLLVPKSDAPDQMEEYIAFETNHAKFTTNHDNTWRTIDGKTQILGNKVNMFGHLQLQDSAKDIAQTLSGMLNRAVGSK